MVQVIQAKDVTLAQLSQSFGLERTDDENFFREWQDNLTELNSQEKQALNEVKNEYLHLSKYPLLEPIVKMVVLSPLWQIARSCKTVTDMERYNLLLEGNSNGTLTSAERLELMTLRHDADLFMLRKAQAAVLLRWRGHQVSNP